MTDPATVLETAAPEATALAATVVEEAKEDLNDRTALNDKLINVQSTASPYAKGIWMEIKLQGKLPERRSNHSSFIGGDYLYIHGGRDLKEGALDNMWKLNLGSIGSLQNDSNYPL